MLIFIRIQKVVEGHSFFSNLPSKEQKSVHTFVTVCIVDILLGAYDENKSTPYPADASLTFG